MAARAGVQVGDVLLQMANVEIADTRQFAAVAARTDKDRPVSVLIRRGDWVNYVLIRPR